MTERRLVAISIVLAMVAIAAMVSFALSGCGTRYQAPPTPMTVDVPIAKPVYCEVAIPARPALPIAELRPDSPPADTVRSYAATVVLLKAAVVERERILAGCTGPAGSEVTPDDHRVSR